MGRLNLKHLVELPVLIFIANMTDNAMSEWDEAIGLSVTKFAWLVRTQKQLTIEMEDVLEELRTELGTFSK